ncbi:MULTISPECIES: hypothetical protein [Methanothrix]|nr:MULTISPECIES: hypothetical protein [Methanothrix]MDD3552638.1 hypothetical protein [Methanothrix soehngenii]HOE46604.1 hypothetical protein [Methanothrix soehngenii]HOS23467.1 hypothetical protein [Methanothrix soehngenii]HPL21698.1 hypothetical protein [Methanothrix soehngenii]HQN30171.1 hypothetical protein [Methanothrix soehngenii]
MLKDLKKMTGIEMMVLENLTLLDIVEARDLAIKLERSIIEKKDAIRVLKVQARLEDLSVYCVKMEKVVRKGKTKIYTYWYASWRDGRKVKNVYIGSTNNLSYIEALAKARRLKATFLGLEA